MKIKLVSLILMCFMLSGCLSFGKPKPEWQVIDKHVFIVADETRTINIDGQDKVLLNPYYPNDKAIVCSGEYFKEIFGKSVDDLVDEIT